MTKFEEWFKNNYTLEERMTNPSLRGDCKIVWNAALLHAAEITIATYKSKNLADRSPKLIAARLREEAKNCG